MSDFKNMRSAKEINDLITDKAFNHTEYYHYSDIDAIKGILSKKKIWVSSMCFSNDATEHNRFGDDTYRYFQLCFSTGTTENLPLWFLYSGINGKGLRIAFKKSDIRKICNLDDIRIELFDNDTEKRVQLINGRNCSVQFKDVIYRKKESNGYRLKYNQKVCYGFPKNEMMQVESYNTGFIKDIIWFYEKETRLLIKVTSDDIEKSRFNEVAKSPYRVELTIPDECFRNINILFSPTYEYDSVVSALQDDAFKEMQCAKVMSEYAGSVKIDLCRDCKRKKGGADNA